MVVPSIMRGTVTEAFLTYICVSDRFEVLCGTIVIYFFGHVSCAVNTDERGGCCELPNNTRCSDRSPAAVVCEAWSTEHFTERHFRSKHPKRDHHTEKSEQVSKQNNSLEHRKTLGQKCVKAGGEECDGDGLVSEDISAK